MKQIKVVAFDCDGVLFDSIEANTAYYNQILKYFGKPLLTSELLEYANMHTGDEVIARLFENKESFQAAQTYRKQMGYFPFIPIMKLEPHLISLMEWLNPKTRTAIATNRADTIQSVLEEFSLVKYFDLVVSSADVARPKPDPEILNKILDHFDTDPRQAVYVGDSLLDEQAAKAAGIPFVAYDNPSLSAEYHIQSLDELKNLLNGSLNR